MHLLQSLLGRSLKTSKATVNGKRIVSLSPTSETKQTFDPSGGVLGGTVNSTIWGTFIK